MFWRQVAAVVMFILAIFLLLGGFGTGGPLPTALFDGVYWTLGIAAYLSPLALIFWGVHKFASEDHEIPISKSVSMLSLLIITSAWLHTGFADKNPATGTWEGGFGGNLGQVIGNVILTVIDKWPASIMFFVLTILCFCWVFGVSLKVLLDIFKRPERKDTDLGELKAGAVKSGLRLHEGVPIERHEEPVAAMRQASPQSQQALTEQSDPNWQFPPLSLLNQKQDKADPGNMNNNAEIISNTLSNFSIDVEMEEVNVGPRVTQYTLKPPTGIKLSKITALDDNLALELEAQSIRIEAPIPGKRAVGIEVPNVKPAKVRIASILTSDDWKNYGGGLPFAVGMDISGKPIIADLSEMPHVLIAGQTKAGKSVMINSLLTSLLYRNSPSDLKLILVDPKHVELTPYNDIPHLLSEVITEPEKCISALKWAVAEMERRYRTLAEAKTRNLQEYNQQKESAGMPYIVLVIDELADLMSMAARDVEALIVRIAQKARAVGIHLVLATQRPSVDVITGLIKANVPARVAFTTTSQIDSRTIIDQTGAEKLLGRGDMLFLTSEMPKPKRIQGALIDTDETQKITDFLRMQRPPQYDDDIVSQPVQLGKGSAVMDYASGAGDSDDEMFRDAVKVVIDNHKASTSLLQRRLRIGYGRASRLIDIMEEQGIVSHADGSKPREVLVSSIDEVFGGGAEAPEQTANEEDEPGY